MKKAVPSVMYAATANADMPIYTKKGDRGTTMLFAKELTGGERIYKSEPRLQAIGKLDELNSYLGIIIALRPRRELIASLTTIQSKLFIINSQLAGAKLKLRKKDTLMLEKKIDQIDQVITPLSNFILPGGSLVAAHLHYARTLVRRAERALVALSQTAKVEPETLKFVNRLSDIFFTFARFENYLAKEKETPWKGSSK